MLMSSITIFEFEELKYDDNIMNISQLYGSTTVVMAIYGLH